MGTMVRSDSHEEIFGSNNQMSVGDFLDGTSARTRPLSYDDIMLRRKNNRDKSRRVPSSSRAEDNELAQENMLKASDIPERQPQINENSKPGDRNKNSIGSKNVSSRRKADNDDPNAKSKDKVERTLRHNTSEEKTEGRNHASRKKYDHLSVSSDNGLDKRKDSDSHKLDRVSKRSRVKSEIVKTQPHSEERQVYRKRKTDERMGSGSDNECKKRNMRDVKQADKSTVRGREKSVKEKRHKYHHEEDKSRGRDHVKKNDSERKESEPVGESSSRRRDCEKDRGKKSHSQSPKAYKHTSKDAPSSLLTKDTSGKEHSNADSKRVSSNGSNSHYRRNTNTSSGLGGYSPRKRKTDAAAKTPSPTRRTPERRSAGWDLQPAEKDIVMTTSTIANLSQKLSLNLKEYPSITPLAPTIGISLHTLSSQMHAIESIQLTQATRPKRRLYVENLPVSASEKDLIECTNKLLLSSGVNYVQGTQPCISCIIHKEKKQALLEFLTPEDASAALSLDGMSFSGSKIKLRRPKDYTDVTTGLSDKSVGVVDSISDTVEDSPNKIFIGGISKLISSSMLLEIARTFGPVKAFHFEFLASTNEPCAFIEYVDHSVTSKACAGLNGMRVGGQFLTAVVANPDPVLENVGKPPTYVIPDHAKPLIEKPTAILKLKNVLDPESESELGEILEDIRLECSRFGIVRSVNVSKKTNVEANEVKRSRLVGDEIIAGNITKDEVSSNGEEPRITSDSEVVRNCSNAGSSCAEEELKLEEHNANSEVEVNNVELDSSIKREEVDAAIEAGSVIVEYTRAEAACMAAHCLHGRTFDGRVVTVEYV